MILRILYSIAVIILIFDGTLLVLIGWLLYRHLWYEFVDWLDEAGDRGLIWMADRVLGEHKTIDKEQADE